MKPTIISVKDQEIDLNKVQGIKLTSKKTIIFSLTKKEIVIEFRDAGEALSYFDRIVSKVYKIK